MVVQIPPELEEFVNAAIASGEFKSKGEVVTEALRLLRDRLQRIKELRDQIEPAVNRLRNGRGIEVDLSNVKSRALSNLRSEAI